MFGPQPLVSVVLPTHNRPQWLAGALTSVLHGRFDDLEVVVSNNGDPEHTRRLRSVISDERVRWIEQDPGLDILDHLLAALSYARGRYVALLHDDDWWSQEFLAALVPPLEQHPEAVLAFADHYLVNEHGELMMSQTNACTRRWGRSGLRDGFYQPFFAIVAHQSVPATASVFRRDRLPLDEITPEIGSCYDVWTPYLLAKGGGAAYFTARRLMYNRAHQGSHSSSAQLSSRFAAIRCKRAMLNDPDIDAYRGVIIPTLARDHELVAAQMLRHGERRKARVHLAAALRLQPTAKAVAGLTASWAAPHAILTHV